MNHSPENVAKSDDEDIEKALLRFLGFLNAHDRKTRITALERDIEIGMRLENRNFNAGDYDFEYGARDLIIARFGRSTSMRRGLPKANFTTQPELSLVVVIEV